MQVASSRDKAVIGQRYNQPTSKPTAKTVAGAVGAGVASLTGFGPVLYIVYEFVRKSHPSMPEMDLTTAMAIAAIPALMASAGSYVFAWLKRNRKQGE